MGFSETGEIRAYQGEAVTNTVSLMEKPLAWPTQTAS